MAASESGSYFMAILEVKDMKAHSVFNTCSQLYPLASLTRLISMGNVYMKTKRLGTGKTLQSCLFFGHSFRPVRLTCTRSYMYEGDMGVYGIAVLGFFSCGILGILILTCGIVVSSSSAVRDFHHFG